MCSKAPSSPPPFISELVVRIALQKAIFRAFLSLSPTLQLSLRKLDQLRTNKEREKEVGRLLESRGMRADYDDGGGRGVGSSQEKEVFSTSHLEFAKEAHQGSLQIAL